MEPVAAAEGSNNNTVDVIGKRVAGNRKRPSRAPFLRLFLPLASLLTEPERVAHQKRVLAFLVLHSDHKVEFRRAI